MTLATISGSAAEHNNGTVSAKILPKIVIHSSFISGRY